MVEQAGEWGVEGEEYEEGETILDVLCRVEAQDAEVPRYPPVPGYDNPYTPDVQEQIDLDINPLPDMSRER